MPRKAKAKPKTGNKRVTEAHVTIGQKLRAARLQAGMTQDQLGEVLGVSFQQIQKYEKGINRIDVNRMFECAKALNVDYSYFIDAISVERSEASAEFDAVLASREGVQIIEAMVEMSPPQRQFLIDIARKLPHLAEA